MSDDRPLVGIDVGSSSVKVVVAVPEPHRLVIKGSGEARHDGARKGIISKLDEVTRAVQSATREAEAMASTPIEQAIIALGGTPIRGTPAKASAPVTGPKNTVSHDDLTLVLDRCAGVAIPDEYKVLDIIPCGFTLDGQPGLEDPEGMAGRQLGATAFVLFTTKAHADTVEQVVNQAAVAVTDVIYEPLAASNIVLSHDERELGCLLVDIGHSTTDWVLWNEGVVLASNAFPVGGRHFTADVATLMNTTTKGGEKIKLEVGVHPGRQEIDLVSVEVPEISGHGNRIIEGRDAVPVLYERAHQLFTGIARDLAAMELDRVPRAGIVLTGGGAGLDGLEEVAEAIFGHNARIGRPRDLAGEVEPVSGPQWSVATGMIRLAHRRRQQTLTGRRGGGGVIDRLRDALSEIFDLGGGNDLHR
ncbi:MAG: cell division protein FtsA [Thermoanaerobaculales bacterium]|nr:cell division protein FtsA [Thermoanaerobaculales bacterium]